MGNDQGKAGGLPYVFIEQVPLVKYTLGQNMFYYHHYMPEDKASLFYVALPPFGRPMYFFPENRWSYMD